jgi:hypothetical protein
MGKNAQILAMRAGSEWAKAIEQKVGINTIAERVARSLDDRLAAMMVEIAAVVKRRDSDEWRRNR